MLAVAGDLGHHLPVHQPEVTGVARDLDRARACQQPVEGICGRALEEGVVTGPSLGVDDVRALPPALDELETDRGRVLQVGVHDDHGVGIDGVEPGRDRHLVTEVAREPDHRDTRVRLVQAQELGERGVTRTIVDVDELELVLRQLLDSCGPRSRGTPRCRPTRCRRAARTQCGRGWCERPPGGRRDCSSMASHGQESCHTRALSSAIAARSASGVTPGGAPRRAARRTSRPGPRPSRATRPRPRPAPRASPGPRRPAGARARSR